jgi:sodium-dependent dicarboxylate transporter 2/3/5
MGTPIGTPPNVLFMGVWEQTSGREMSFLEWMKLAVPVLAIMFPVIWLWLCRRLGRPEVVELPQLGPWRTEERRVLIAFILTAAAWIFRKEPFGGWSGLLNASGADDSTVALIAVMALFVWPNGYGGRLLDWETAKRIPWGLLLMFGAGITIARSFDASGLSDSIGNVLTGLKNWHPLAMVAMLCLAVGLLTNVTSNTAMAALLLPLLAAAAKAAGMNPAMMMMPVVLSTSCAFMLPVGTPPNAIVYGSGYVTVRTMVREGFIVTLLGAIVVSLICYLLVPILFNA